MLSVDSWMMFPNNMISEGLPPYISRSRGLSDMYMEGQRGHFWTTDLQVVTIHTMGLILAMHLASTGLLRKASLLMFNPKYLGPNPIIQWNSKLPIDFTVGKIRPLVKGIFYNATLPALL